MVAGKNRERYIIILPSIHFVLKAEKLLKKTDHEFELVPVPKEVNPECGMALATSVEEFPDVSRILIKHGLDLVAVYRRNDREFEMVTP